MKPIFSRPFFNKKHAKIKSITKKIKTELKIKVVDI